MQATELKALVEAGDYKPDPSRVATAMLRRRGVRELLVMGNMSIAPAGRIRQPAEARRQAA